MRRHASHSTRLASVFFALVFLWATGPDAYGLHPCPHHGAAAPGGERVEADASDAPASPHADPTDAHGSEDPCSCIENCHASAEPPAPTGGVDSRVDEPRSPLASASPSTDSEVLGSRHAPFELHLPNAPPLSR